MFGYTIETEQKRAERRGATKVGGFSGAVRNNDETSFVKGDVFEIVTPFEVYEEKVGSTSYKTQYIFVKCESGEIKRFYPSSLTKSVLPTDDNGVVIPNIGREKASGSVCELFKISQSVQDGMEAIAKQGKKIKVTDVKRITTYGFNGQATRNTSVLTLDFV